MRIQLTRKLDVPIQNDHFMASNCESAGDCHAGWPGTDEKNHMPNTLLATLWPVI